MVDLEERVMAEEGIEVVEDTMISGVFEKCTFFLQNLFYLKKQYLKSPLPK